MGFVRSLKEPGSEIRRGSPRIARAVAIGIAAIFIVTAIPILLPSQSTAWSELNTGTSTQDNWRHQNDTVLWENLTSEATAVGAPTIIPLPHGGLSDGMVYRNTGNQSELWKYNATSGHFSWAHYFGGVVKIMDAVQCADRSVVVSLDNGSVYRADPTLTIWEHAFKASISAKIWQLTVDLNLGYVFGGEYGYPVTYPRYWRSTSNGTNGSWAVVGHAPYNVSGNNHIHLLQVDPYTGYVYAVTGDQYDHVDRSTDNGTTWVNWSQQRQFTALAFTRTLILGGNDNTHEIFVYNKTTGVEELAADPGWGVPLQTAGAFYSMCVGAHDVIYAQATTEGVAGRAAGIYCSVDGHDWYAIVNTTSVGRDSGSYIAYSGGFVYWTGMREDKNTNDILRFPDLTQAEAKRLIYADPDIAASTNAITYNVGGIAFNGQSQYISFPQDIIDNQPVITFTGNYSKNYLREGGFETVENWYAAPGWVRTNYSGKGVNGSIAQSPEAAHSGTYGMKMAGGNESGHHYRVESQIWDDAGAAIPVGATLYFSYWCMYTGNDSIWTDGWLSMNVHLVYTDATTNDWGLSAYAPLSCPDVWTRLYGIKVLPKAVRSIYVGFYSTGNMTAFVDDVAMHVNWLRPFPGPYGGYNTTDPTIYINGVPYEYSGTLVNGQTANVTLPPLGGTTFVNFSVGGSDTVKWSIRANRTATVTGMYAKWYDYTNTHYDFTAIAGANDVLKLEANELIKIDLDYGGGVPGVAILNMTTTGQVNFTLNGSFTRGLTAEGAIPFAWAMNGSVGGGFGLLFVTFQIDHLQNSTTYEFLVDGVKDSDVTSNTTGVASWNFDGPWSNHTMALRIPYAPYVPPGGGGAAGAGLFADFEYSVRGSRVAFTDTSTGNTEIVQWLWYFGDGESSMVADPYHRYDDAGSYAVTLVIYDSRGVRATTTQAVIIQAGLPTLSLLGDGNGIFSEGSMLPLIIASAFGVGIVAATRRPTAVIVAVILVTIGLVITLRGVGWVS